MASVATSLEEHIELDTPQRTPHRIASPQPTATMDRILDEIKHLHSRLDALNKIVQNIQQELTIHDKEGKS
jgi:hypothetical protein